MFEQFVSRRTITGSIVATTALHVGAAEDDFSPNGEKNAFLRNALDQPFIPGSSLKGIMRSFLESLLSGRDDLLGDEKKRVCSLSSMCIEPQDAEYKRLARESVHSGKAEAELAAYIQANTCVICRLFGSQVNGAKLMVRDAALISDTFERNFEKRSGVTIDRDLGTKKDKHFYTMEVVPSGTAFALEAVVENASNTEWECICIILRAMELEMLAIGGMTSRGLGGFRLEKCEVSEMTPSNLRDILLLGESAPRVPLHQFVPAGGC